MATIESAPKQTLSQMYDDVLAALPIDPDGILAFNLPARLQKQLSKLAARNTSGKLSDNDRLDLQKFIALEATMRALKSKALVAKSGQRK